jgi:hypothetical protein
MPPLLLASILNRYDIASILEEVAENPEMAPTAIKQLTVRQADLGLTAPSSKETLILALQKTLSDPFEQAVQFVRLNNKRGALSAMLGVLDAKDAAAAMLDACSADGAIAPSDVESFFLGALNMRVVSPSVARELYGVLLADALESADEYTMAAVQDMEVMMDLDQAAVDAIYAEICGPLLRARLVTSLATGDTAENMSPAAKEANEMFVQSMHIPDAVYSAVSIDIYANKLAAATGGGRILSASEREELNSLRAFLDVDEEKTYDMHLDACAGAFKQSVFEAMGATGVINADYKEGLAKLGERLMLRESDQIALYQQAMRDRLTPIVDRVVAEFERAVLSKDQYGAKTGKDQGEDLFVQGGGTALGLEAGANLLLEVVNLVDFFEGNKLWAPADDGEGTFDYAVTAKGMKEAPLLEDVFRQFIVSSFQAKGPGVENRYKLAQEHFAGILGITPERRAEIQNDIGKVVYGNYVNNLLRSKGSIETQDFQYLVNIQQMLNMDEDVCMQELIDLKNKYAKTLVAAAFKETSLTRATIEKLKSGIDKLGVDLVEDVGLEIHHRVQFFVAESMEAIENGNISVDQKEVIEEIQESWQVSNDDATAAFTAAVQQTCQDAATQAASDFKSQNDLQALQGLEKIIRLAQFVPVAVNADMRLKEKLIQLYKTAKTNFKEGVTAEEEANIALLTKVLQ